jgi:hypothetical protein
MICGETRPDAKISVEHRPVKGAADAFPETRVNVRYCNDRKECTDKARVWHE